MEGWRESVRHNRFFPNEPMEVACWEGRLLDARLVDERPPQLQLRALEGNTHRRKLC
jgi:hypothetical protein